MRARYSRSACMPDDAKMPLTRYSATDTPLRAAIACANTRLRIHKNEPREIPMETSLDMRAKRLLIPMNHAQHKSSSLIHTSNELNSPPLDSNRMEKHCQALCVSLLKPNAPLVSGLKAAV